MKTRISLSIFYLLFFATRLAISQTQKLQVAPIFTDNMVLQQQQDVAVWGKDFPEKVITITSSWNTKATAIAGIDGMWSTVIKTKQAGGPYQLTISDGDSTIVIKNILLGEVWLCSGQSNMEMPLAGWPPQNLVDSSAAEIQNSSIPEIRLFTVRRSFSVTPKYGCTGSWEECSPKTTPSFSAAAYFFGRDLYRALKVPIGLIHSSWGGTAIESWIGEETLSKVHQYDSLLNKIDESKDSIAAMEKWLQSFPAIPVNERDSVHKWEHLDFNDKECALEDFADSTWRDMKLPTYWEETRMGSFDGAVWFRKHVEIPKAWRGSSLTLSLGPVDDMDETYVNGTRVGGIMLEGYWQAPRTYTIPDSLNRDSVLVVAVRVLDIQGNGGIYGKPENLFLRRNNSPDTSTISLAGNWKFLPVADLSSNVFYIFGWRGQQYFNHPKLPIDYSNYLPTVLFNGMIAPLIPFSLRGTIWYQGESNVGNPEMYAKLFPMMIEEWRTVFRDKEMPFFFVQIAPFEYGPDSKSELLREAQFKTLSVKNTGMAVTLDIGNPISIHPGDKQDVGKRLALWALAKVYDRNIAYSGPLYRSMTIKKNAIILSFDDAGARLVLRKSEQGNQFQIAGADKHFVNADVVVKGKTLVVSSPAVAHPEAVKYAFTNAPDATLFNSYGLPASSFRTDGW
jgi:sialate O-acetylesterase